VTRPASFLRLATRSIALLCSCALLAIAGAAGAQSDDKAADKDKKEERTKSVGLSKRVADKLTEVNALIEANNFKGALTQIDGVAKRRGLSDADNAQIHRFRGYILMSMDQPKEAAKEFEISLATQGLDASAEQQMMYSLAQIYTSMSQFDKALEVINRWFEAEATPKPDAYFLKAMILVQQEKFKDALAPAKVAVESEKPRESWVGLLVAIYNSLDDYPNVATTLERLISINPTKKSYWVQLAAVQNLLDREAKALAMLRLAREADLLTEDREFKQLARLLFLRDLPYQCAKTIEEGMTAKVVKADAESYRLLSNCYIAARETDKALPPLEKAGELAPDGEMYMLLGQMHLQRDRFDPAIAALKKALSKAKPEQRGAANLMIGVAELGKNNYAAAERSFQAAHGDPKVRNAAESYLKFVSDQRAREKMLADMAQQAAADAEAAADGGAASL
jgi:tetratricopeptide (TPR) repeat protein